MSAADLRAALLDRGATAEQIARAEREGWLPLLALDRFIMPGAPEYTLSELAARADVDPETARRLWRTLGFPDVPDSVAGFSDDDVEALRLAVRRFESGAGFQRMLHQVRVISAALTRIAHVEADVVVAGLTELRAAGFDEEEVAATLVDALEWDSLQRLIDYAHRLQLRAAVWRRLARGVEDSMLDVAVGFVDLAGYTRLSEELSVEELDALLTDFEARAYDTAAELRGRVVKTIGDEVMFVAVDARDAVEIALRLVEAGDGDRSPLDARAGLAYGAALGRDGDYYGPTVNLASRLTDRAYPGSVLVSDAVHATLADDPTLQWRRLRNRKLRDVGVVDLWVTRRGAPLHRGDAPEGAERGGAA